MPGPGKSRDPGIEASIRESGRTAQHGAPREISSARHSSMPRLVLQENEKNRITKYDNMEVSL